jgi:hypothetical protein
MKTFSVLAAGTLGLAIISRAQNAPIPFRSCAASSPQVLKLSIEQLHPEGQNIELGIHLKNVSQKEVTVEKRDPERLFAVRVTGASGVAVPFTSKGNKLYGPASPNEILFESAVGPVTLLSGQELTLHWNIGDYFEFLKPGISKVQLKESIDLTGLNATVCSNILTIQIQR